MPARRALLEPIRGSPSTLGGGASPHRFWSTSSTAVFGERILEATLRPTPRRHIPSPKKRPRGGRPSATEGLALGPGKAALFQGTLTAARPICVSHAPRRSRNPAAGEPRWSSYSCTGERPGVPGSGTQSHQLVALQRPGGGRSGGLRPSPTNSPSGPGQPLCAWADHRGCLDYRQPVWSASP